MANNRLMNMTGEIIGIADILFADTAANSNTPNQANGSVTLNLGFAESGEGQSQQAELWNSPGIISVPALPTAANNNSDAAQGLYYNHSDQNIIFAVRDTRSQAIAKNINPGETCVYAPGSQASVLLKNDGTATLSTTDDNTATGNSLKVSVGPAGIQLITPWATLVLDQTGIHANTSSGAKLDMNGTADVTTGGNAVMISCGVFTANSSSINLGPITGVFLPAIVSDIVPAIVGVPILGAGVGTVVIAAAASPVVNISAG